MDKQNHHPLFSNEEDDNTMLSNFGIEFPNCYFNPNWDHSGPSDQSDPFESALSSMVSSPATTVAGDGMVLRELIGRLGTICGGGETEQSPHTSCYATPLNSPPKLSLVNQARARGSLLLHQQAPSGGSHHALAALSANAEFADRTARFLSRCSSPDQSSVSEQNTNENAKKRKPVSRGKGKETTLPSPAKTDPKVSKENDESDAKKRKQNEERENKSGPKANTAEPPKDYIHVRARRGQATDSHSLAERVRREKIGERMKFLQDLVPGCNKVIGKAVMLDEIINYVQSLQRQVEFLSMKLATVNPRMEFNAEALLSKDIFQSRASIPQNIYPLDTTFSYGYQSAQGPFSMPPLNSVMPRNTNMQFPSVDGFNETASQSSAFWEDDLHTVVQMGFGQNQLQNLHNGIGHMKVEL